MGKFGEALLEQPSSHVSRGNYNTVFAFDVRVQIQITALANEINAGWIALGNPSFLALTK
jgi:hypothetical protein